MNTGIFNFNIENKSIYSKNNFKKSNTTFSKSNTTFSKPNINSHLLKNPLSRPKKNLPIPTSLFDKNKTFYICSYGGCGSTLVYNYLSNFGKVEHIHDRFPPDKLTYVGKNHSSDNIYNEWFNRTEIPNEKLHEYKVIYIYRNPIDVIFSRFGGPRGPNIPHLKHVMCDNDGNIDLTDVIKQNKDLYKLEEFFDNYTTKKNRNYNIYCVKYESFFQNISLFNKVMNIPDVKGLYPQKYERRKKIYYRKQLNNIYKSLKLKMLNKPFIQKI